MSNLFRVLMVCTGNICRSAQAEQILRARLEEQFPELESVVVVESAGTGAMVGSAMPDEAAELSVQNGGAPQGHSARQLTADHVRTADLVLGMAAEHRRAVVRLLPRASRNTFTLTEFVALLENVEQNPPRQPEGLSALDVAANLRQAIRWISARRGYLPSEGSIHPDVVDPYRRSEETYAESARQIVEALNRTQQAAINFAQRVST